MSTESKKRVSVWGLVGWGLAVFFMWRTNHYRQEWYKAVDSYCRVVDMAWELKMRHDALGREVIRLGHDANSITILPGDTPLTLEPVDPWPPAETEEAESPQPGDVVLGEYGVGDCVCPGKSRTCWHVMRGNREIWISTPWKDNTYVWPESSIDTVEATYIGE